MDDELNDEIPWKTDLLWHSAPTYTMNIKNKIAAIKTPLYSLTKDFTIN